MIAILSMYNVIALAMGCVGRSDLSVASSMRLRRGSRRFVHGPGYALLFNRIALLGKSSSPGGEVGLTGVKESLLRVLVGQDHSKGRG
ncbi:hypothetical protein BDV93DRAFT_264108 [Ceratobasidium sp. AG-I]|nr:hypothetical protein BDV93DRAFT_264108 [Ceratobasidium sp. AG-I]